MEVFKKHILVIIFALAGFLPACAQYYDIYQDPPTEAAMYSTYMLEAAAEGLPSYMSAQDSSSIRASYRKMMADYALATVASSGIYLYKHMEWKALHDVGRFGSEDARYFKEMVALAKMITRETLICTYYLAKYPTEFLSWGPYIFNVCNETIDMCAQYEAIVSNMKVHFDPSLFLTLSPELAKFANIAARAKDIKGVNFNDILDEIGRLSVKGVRDEIDNIKAGVDGKITDVSEDMNVIGDDIQNIKNIGSTIASAGSTISDAIGSGSTHDFFNLMGNSKLAGAFKNKPAEIRAAYDHVRGLIDEYNPAHIKDRIKGFLYNVKNIDGHEIAEVALDKIFVSADFAVQSYLSDYIKTLKDQYYKQKFQIVIRNAGSETVCDFKPEYGDGMHYRSGNYISWKDDADRDANDVTWKKNGWVCAESGYIRNMSDLSKPKFIHTFTSSEKEQALQKAESLSGWSRSSVERLSGGDNNGITYTFVPTEVTAHRYVQENASRKYWSRHDYLAYQILVTKNWQSNYVYWEKDIDSQEENPEAVQNEVEMERQMAVEYVISHYGRQADTESGNESVDGLPDGWTVEVVTGEPRYYQQPSDQDIQEATRVAFILNCENHQKLGSGDLTWKENDYLGKGNTVTDHTRRCAMVYNAPKGGMSSDDSLSIAIRSKNTEISGYKSQISSYRKQFDEAVKKGDNNTASALDAQLNSLENKLDNANRELSELKDAQQMASADRDAIPQKHRIPWLVRSLATQYHVEWEGDIESMDNWDGDTYTIHGKMTGLTGEVTFKGNLVYNREESYTPVFHIRYHRAILDVKWEIYGDQSSSNVIETMSLDKGRSVDENQKIVEDKQKKYMDMFPDCDVILSYAKGDSLQQDNGGEPVHLMWLSDRLSLANRLVTQMASLYSDLVLLHRFLADGETVKEFLTREIGLRTSATSRGTVAQDVMSDWVMRAKKVSQELTYGGLFDKDSRQGQMDFNNSQRETVRGD